MRRVLNGVSLTLGLILVLTGVALAQRGMMGMMGIQMMEDDDGMEEMMGPRMPQMRPGMMGGGMRGMARGMGMPQPGQMVRMLQVELGLSDAQAKQLKEIFSQAAKISIKQRADLHIAELELRELVEADSVDLAQVESKLKAIEGLRTTLRLHLIKAHEHAKGVLTPEQRQKLAQLHDRPPGMMASGMMGGGMGGQPQNPAPMASAPQKLTQQDTQGAVTVEATLLTLDKLRADGKLAVQVKLDTHAVDLDQYQLEKLATLRDTQGQEIQALGLESPSGSGHHREGVLIFPGTDASGKPVLGPEVRTLTLILRGVGGVPERVFRWQLPLG